MKVASIIKDSVVDGDGLRDAIFFQGCSINCKGCHNPESHNKRKGHNWSPVRLLKELINSGEFNSWITLTGGEPLEQHLDQLLEFIHLFKKHCKKIKKRPNIWIYSGKKYEYNDLIIDKYKYNILKECNVLVDGPFMINKKKELLFRGSSNQRIINLKKTFKNKKITYWKHK